MAVLVSDGDGQQAVKIGTLQPVQLVKGAVRASAGVHVHHAQLSASMGGVTADGRVLRQGALTAG